MKYFGVDIIIVIKVIKLRNIHSRPAHLCI